MSYDNLATNLLGSSESLFFKLESDEGANTVAEAEVSISVTTSEDQMDDLAADTAADEVVEATDAASTMFYSLNNLYALKKVLDAGEISQGLYTMLNSNGQLDRLAGKTLPSFESLNATGNPEVADTLKTCVEAKLTAPANAELVAKGFDLIGKRIDSFGTTFATVLRSRHAALAKLLAKLEADEEVTDVEVTVTEPSEEVEAGTVTTTPEVAEPAEGETVTEPVTEVTTTADVATPEETAEAVEALMIPSLTVTPIIAKLNDVAGGSADAYKAVYAFNSDVKKAKRKLRASMTLNRKFVATKQSIIDGIKVYMNAIEQSQGFDMLLVGAKAVTTMGTKTPMVTSEAFATNTHLLLAVAEANTYMVNTKKVMDSTYYNLKFLASKALVKNNK